MPAIRTIFFDAAGTLFHLPKGVGWHYRDVASRFGCQLDENALSQAFRKAWKQMPPRRTTQEPRNLDDKPWWSELVLKVLKECGAPSVPLLRDGYFEALYAEFTLAGVWELFPETREVLKHLADHYRLGLISNFDQRLHPILGHLGLTDYFDPIVISSEVGADKPDPWIFQHALHRASSHAGRTLHVGDDARCDWEGATAAGLHVFRLQRPENSLRDLLAQLENNPL